MKIKLYSGGYPPVFLGWVEPETLADGFIDVTKACEPRDVNGDPIEYEVIYDEENKEWYAKTIS